MGETPKQRSPVWIMGLRCFFEILWIIQVLSSLNKGNRKWFVEAMLYIELGTAPDKAGAEINGKVSRMADAIMDQKASMVDPKILSALAPTSAR